MAVDSTADVVLRIRPLGLGELPDDRVRKSTFRTLQVANTDGARKEFTFTHVFDADVTQDKFYQQCGVRGIVSHALDGNTSTVIAYGQTGSGKTFTMSGPWQARLQTQDLGLIQRCVRELITNDNVSLVGVTFFEVYKERVHDLLSDGSEIPINIRGSADSGFYISKLRRFAVSSMSQFQWLFQCGMERRTFDRHDMNEHSSRSHAILTVDIEDTRLNKVGGSIRFVDLAGSESAKKTGNYGEMQSESKSINQSLLVLKKCLLAVGQRRGGHVPFRDSILTKLLFHSKNGFGKTLFIACVSQASSNNAETVNTLRYAVRAKNIRQAASEEDNSIEALRKEVVELRRENESLRKRAFVAGDGGGSGSSGVGSGGGSGVGSGGADEGRGGPSLYPLLQTFMLENEKLRKEVRWLAATRQMEQAQHPSGIFSDPEPSSPGEPERRVERRPWNDDISYLQQFRRKRLTPLKTPSKTSRKTGVQFQQ